MRLHLTTNNIQAVSYRIQINCNCKNSQLVKNIFKVKPTKIAILSSNLTILSFSLISISRFIVR